MTTATYDPRRGLYVGGAAFGLPAPPPPRTSAADLELLVRFEHPAKFLAVKELPGAALLGDEWLAASYGTTADAVARIRDGLQRDVRGAAAELLARPGVRDAVAAFPAGTFVALGDSITDDLQSWAEILRACFDAVRPGEIVTINAGVSGDTSADALGRLYGVAELRPDLVVAMLGTNDCQRHGPDAARLVQAGEFVRNVRAITRWLEDGGARVVWLTPPPVAVEALAASVGERPFTIRPPEMAELAAALSAPGLEVVDAGAQLTPDRDLLPDGVHPNLGGQTRIARAVLAAVG